MDAALVESLQSEVSGLWAGLGEDVTIRPDGGEPLTGRRAIWNPEGEEIAGSDDAGLAAEADTFAFRRRDAVSVEAAQVGAEIFRSNGERYYVDAIGALGAETHLVIVKQI